MTAAPPQSPLSKETPLRRVRTPTLIQMEAVECGAACLGIVLGGFGRFVPLEELRVACGVSRDGSKASNLLKAGRTYGLETKAYRHEPHALLNLPLPLIVFWNYAHFVVVEGFGKGKVFINDPASGPRALSWEEFDEGYSGIALTFQKGAGFEPGGKRSQLMGALRSRLKGSGSALAYTFLAGLALAIPGAAFPIFTKIFVDSYLLHGMESLLNTVLWGIALFATLRVALTYLQQRALLRLETRLALQMSGQYFWHALSLPLVFYSQRYAGEIGSRVAISDRIAGLLSGQLASTLLSLFTALFYVLLMFLYDVPLTLIGLTFAGMSLFALHYVSRRRADLNHRMMKERGRLVATTMHGLQMMETLKATGGENDFFMRWSGQQAKLTNAEQELTSSTLYLSAIPPLLTALNIAILLGFGGFRVMSGAMTVGELIALQGLQLGLATPIQDLVNLGAILQEIGADLQRLDDVLQCEPDPAAKEIERDSQEPSTRLTGKLEIRDLTFGYSRLDPPLIENFNLTLQPGRRVALVGGSGSGKSTIARLIMGLYTPWEGEVLFDGKPSNAYSRRLLLHSVAMVDQDIFLFEGTARDNITLWDETLSDEAILQATRDAAIHSDLAIRPGSYECHLAEGGANFSGGQRQRLEIARALALQPSLLILDEATSALDPSTEKTIDENLRRRGCSCLIVAHRLSAIRDCDEIIVLEKGKVVQRGTHTEMMKVEGPYSRLLEARPDTSRKSYLDFA